MPSAGPTASDRLAAGTAADAVVVGGGTVGAWCAYFLRRSGLDRVVLVEKRTLGQGASSRAAGVVRTQGGSPWAVRLGEWSRRFYLSQHDLLGIDSGFTPQGYVIPCFTESDVTAARERMSMQNSLGLDVRWLEPAQLDSLNPTLAPGRTLGGTYCAEDGYLTPPRNVTAYAVALATSGVQVRERVSFTGLEVTGGAVTGALTSAGPIAAPLVVLTGGPEIAEVAGLAGVSVPAGGVRHQVAVTEPHPDLDPVRVPMMFDLAAGLYWRPEEGGLLFGMSNPAEPPGVAACVDEHYLGLMRSRLAELVPVTGRLGLRRLWAATIDYTPDHLPIIGPALVRNDAAAGRAEPSSTLSPIRGVTVASAGGAGMMWGPGVARAAADVALTGTSEVVDVTDLGLDRFDAAGHSKLGTDPIALPFPEAVHAEHAVRQADESLERTQA
ncbi:MAG TPA: FAD-binding oxidoreductase [Streptosporangiaceae bacterium]|jgi:sarcosine oxidase subunit beta|nr:FAD-binding oxidoreductase [Streptosporangiaceae bacterium]